MRSSPLHEWGTWNSCLLSKLLEPYPYLSYWFHISLLRCISTWSLILLWNKLCKYLDLYEKYIEIYQPYIWSKFVCFLFVNLFVFYTQEIVLTNIRFWRMFIFHISPLLGWLYLIFMYSLKLFLHQKYWIPPLLKVKLKFNIKINKYKRIFKD